MLKEKKHPRYKAKGIAESKLLIATAEVESIKSIQEALKDSHARSTDYLIALNYLNSLNRMNGSGKTSKVILVPSDTLDTIGEIMQSVDSQELQTRAPRK